MGKKLLRQLDHWNETDEHEKIIEAICALTEKERDYETNLRLAQALSNLGRCREALQILETEAAKGDADPRWHYRRGYALYCSGRFEEAASAFSRSAKLDASDGDSLEFLGRCNEKLQSTLYHPKQYAGEELDALENFIIEQFGSFEQVFHEIVSPDIHVDICVIEPTPERNYYTLVTLGMGAHHMNLPEELREDKLDRAELLISLPPHWQLGDGDERWYWPLRWLKILARLPGQQDTWLGWGHTVPNGGPFAENTELSGVMLISPRAFPPSAFACKLPDGEEIHFYQVLPLYGEEMDYKIQNGAEALLERMDDSLLEVLDITRLNVCAKNTIKHKKEYKLSPEDIRPLLAGWVGADGCLATDRILVDGCQIGYMYREEPDEDFPDSGWRFTAGDESGEYMDNPENSDAYSLNTLCNADPDILPFLGAPYGSAFLRDENGLFQPCREKPEN